MVSMYEDYAKFEAGKTYIFWTNGGGHFRGKVVKRTAKTVTVQLSDKGIARLWNLYSIEDAKDVAPIRMRIVNDCSNAERAVTHKAGKNACATLDGYAADMAANQM